ncbi:tachylectin-related carbohydrate-binding protein [Lentzea sp. CA-135723]|uniref:tachylectin-related carbohydrate-binding protein n=1 Tax=Lentzea sp. CA-135723 TaxID=3239950 RepID=UPI003D91F0E2
MSKRLRSLCLTAAAVAGTLSVATAGTASAADPTCGSVARVFTVQADGDLWLYEHAAPATGQFSWAGVRQVGWGWGGKTFAGPDGRVYNITTSGELRRLRFNGNGWDTMPGGGQFQTIGWGWQKFLQAANRAKITVDADGAFYTLEGDQLRWWRFDEQTGGWAPGSGRVLDVGWGEYDAVAASGRGGLQAQDAAHALHRYRYDAATERFVVHDVVPEAGWAGHGTLFSPGGDLYYSVLPTTGELRWNRFSEDTGWQSVEGSVIGLGWGTDVDVTASTSDCSITLPVPAPDGGQPHVSQYVPMAADLGTGDRYVVGHQNQDSALVSDWYDPARNWWYRTTLGPYAASRSMLADGSAVLIGAKGPNGIDLLKLRGGAHESTTSLRGGMGRQPVVVRRANGTLAVYSIAFAPNADRGTLHVREQLPNGDFLAWRAFGEAARYSVLTAITRGDETTLLAHGFQVEPNVFRHLPGTAPASAGELTATGVVGELTLVQDSTGRLLVFGARRTDEGIRVVHVRREKADRTGFEDDWQSLGTFGTRNAWNEPVSAQLLANGTIALSVPADGKPWVTTSKSPGSTEFLPWAPVEVPQNTWFVEPTALGLSRTGEVLLTADSSARARYQFTAPAPANPATPLQFGTGKLLGQ